MVQFLLENGYDVAIDDTRSWADRVIAFVEHCLSEEGFAALIRPFVVER
jgi:hypothetical protein